MQVLIRFDTSDADAFTADYAEGRERRDQAGLTQLQMWREDGSTAIWGLYESADKGLVQQWLDTESGLRDHLSGTRAHYLRTL